MPLFFQLSRRTMNSVKHFSTSNPKETSNVEKKVIMALFVWSGLLIGKGGHIALRDWNLFSELHEQNKQKQLESETKPGHTR